MWVLFGCAVTGLVASVALLSDLLSVLSDPTFVPACSINPVISCGSVMQTWQASVFGFANPILGVVLFSVLTGVAAVAATGTRLADLAWWAILAGATAGVVFTHWLAYESLFKIGAVCPYCVIVWATTLGIFLTAAAALSERGNLPRWVSRTVWHVVPVWVTVLTIVILIRFWDYWQTLL